VHVHFFDSILHETSEYYESINTFRRNINVPFSRRKNNNNRLLIFMIDAY